MPNDQALVNSPSALESALNRARQGILDLQHEDGYWCFELEADCTISAEYILMMHFRGEVEAELQSKICVYLRERQGADGGWPLYYGGEMNLSCSVKTYYALKISGDDPDLPHMRRAREAILAQGGAARCNVFTRIALALFEQLPWRGVPFIPVEIMLLPKWFFLSHLKSLLLVADRNDSPLHFMHRKTQSGERAKNRHPGIVRHPPGG